MPEGDTLHRTARTLARALVGKSITRVAGSAPAARGGLEGRKVDLVEARGKHLVIRFDDGRVLETHLRMTGSWHLYRVDERWWRPEHEAKIALEVAPHGADEALVAVCFSAPTVRLDGEAATDARLAHLGPDVVAAAPVDVGAIVLRLRAGPDRAIAVALLDQSALAGVGNVYKSEVLFAARVSPFAPVSALSDATLEALVTRARAAMRRNLAPGQRIRTTTAGLSGARLAVYRRSGEPCPVCGAPIVRAVQGEQRRSTYYCPRCQPGPASPGR